MNNIKNLYDLALLKIIRNFYIQYEKGISKDFISDYFVDFLDGVIETLESL